MSAAEGEGGFLPGPPSSHGPNAPDCPLALTEASAACRSQGAFRYISAVALSPVEVAARAAFIARRAEALVRSRASQLPIPPDPSPD